jgi:hypothetical protein
VTSASQDRPAAVPHGAGPATAAGPSAVATPGTLAPPGAGVPGPASPSLPDRRGGGEAPASGVAAWKAAIARHNAAKRTGRAKRPPPPIVGVRAAQGPRGGGQ